MFRLPWRRRREKLLGLVDREHQRGSLRFVRLGRQVANALSTSCERAAAASRRRRRWLRAGSRAFCEPVRGERRLERVQEAGLAADRRPLRADHWQSEEVAVVAREPRQKSGAQEGRFPRTRGAEDREQAAARRLPVGRAACRVPRRSARRGRRRCRHRRLRAASGRDRAAVRDRARVARRRSADQARPWRAQCGAAPDLPSRR